MRAELLICFQLQGDLGPWPPWQSLTEELFSCAFISASRSAVVKAACLQGWQHQFFCRLTRSFVARDFF